MASRVQDQAIKVLAGQLLADLPAWAVRSMAVAELKVAALREATRRMKALRVQPAAVRTSPIASKALGHSR